MQSENSHVSVSNPMHLALESVVNLILKHRPDLTRERVLGLIRDRISELEGLIDEEAAALLVAKELGVPVSQAVATPHRGRLLVRDLIPGLRNVKILARAIKVSRPLEVKGGKKILRMLVADESGHVNVVAWDNLAVRIFESVKPGDCVLLAGARVARYKGDLEVILSEEAKLEVVENCAIPRLEEMAGLSELNVYLFHVHVVVDGSGGVSAYGTVDGSSACVLLPRMEGVPEVRSGDVILLQDPRRLTSEFPRFLVTRRSRVFLWSKSPVGDSPFATLEVDEFHSSEKYAVGVRGLLVAAIPLRRGSGATIVVGGRRSTARVLTFDDNLAAELSRKKPATPIEIDGICSSRLGLRLNRYFRLKVEDEGGQPEGGKEAGPLAVPNGPVRAEATAISVFFRYCAMSEFTPLIGVVVNLDDGTGWARLLTSYIPFVEELLGASWDEVCEYAAEGVLHQILSYEEEYLRGAELRVSGWLCEDRTLIPYQLRVLTPTR